jgi:hypothetical protein
VLIYSHINTSGNCENDIYKHFSLIPFFRRRLSFLGRRGGGLKYFGAITDYVNVISADNIFEGGLMCVCRASFCRLLLCCIKLNLIDTRIKYFIPFITKYSQLPHLFWVHCKKTFIWRKIEFQNSMDDSSFLRNFDL